MFKVRSPLGAEDRQRGALADGDMGTSQNVSGATFVTNLRRLVSSPANEHAATALQHLARHWQVGLQSHDMGEKM